MAVYSYTRVSTILQAREGESLDVQQRVIAGYAMMNGMAVTQAFVELGVSGSVDLSRRPQGAELLRIIRPGDVVITPKLDRMFRSALDALGVLQHLKTLGVALHMIDLGGDVNSNGISKLVFTILSAVAESERDRIRERVTMAKADQRQRGRYLGGIRPFGFECDGDGALVEVASEQRIIGEVRDMRADGVTFRRIRDRVTGKHGVTLPLSVLHRVAKEPGISVDT